MNPRQRRGVLFLAVAVIGAIAVFFSVIAYVSKIQSEVGDRVAAYVLKREVDAYQPLGTDDLQRVEVPQRWLPDGTVRDLGQLSGRVSAARLQKGTLLQNSTLVNAPDLEAGQREVAIFVDAETGVAGKLRPGDHVDVWSTFSADTTGTTPRTKLIAQDLLVISVGVKVNKQQKNLSGGVSSSEKVPVTFATAQEQIKALTFSEGFAQEVRLALRPPGDTTQVDPDQRTYVETFGGKQ